MQFKQVGKLFEGEEWKAIISGGGLKANNFKTASSISDMDNITAEMFNKQFRIGSNGISEFNKSQIEAKANAIGLTDSLKNEILALANDADITDKLKTGKVTWAKAIANSGDEIDTVADALKKSGKLSDEWITRLNNSSADKLKQNMLDAVNATDGLADSFVKLESKTSGSGGFFSSAANLGKGLLASLKAIAPYAITIGAVVGAFALLDHAMTGYSRAQSKLSESSSKYEETKSELQSLTSQLDETKSRMEELQDLQSSSGQLSFAEETELEKLQQKNDELQRQIDLKQSLADIEAKQVAEDAKNASSKNQTRYDYNKEKHGFLGGLWHDLIDNFAYNKLDENGNMVLTSNAMEWKSRSNGDTTILGQFKANIKDLEDYKERLADVETKLAKSPKDSNLLSQQESLSKSISDTTKELTDQSDTIQQWIDSAKDENGNVLDGMQSFVRDCSKALTEYNNIGKTAKEIDLNNLNNFFSNDKSAKAYFDSIIKNGGSAEDALKAFKATGLSLDDIGVSEDGFIRYFQDLVKAANEASDALDEVDNNLTMTDVENAFSSKNAGDDYVSLGGYLDKAYDLFQKGLTGTDDFKSVAELISYNVDSTAESFEHNYQRLQRYFTKDGDGEYTAEGVSNFLNDLQSLGKGYAQWNEEAGKWDLNMNNTAQAAKDMDMSVQSFEAMLGRIQDYDNVGDFKFVSAVKEFNEAKDALSQLQETYDSMGKNDSGRDALKAKLDQWTPQIEAAENDLSSLPREVITQIKFEYDKSQLKQVADESYNRVQLSNFQNVQDNATAIVAGQNYQETLKGNLDFSQISKEKIPVYFDAEDAISNLKEQLASGDLSEDQTLDIQAEIINLQNIQNQILEAFENAHPEITPETDTATANATFEEWLASEDGKKAVVEITGDSKDAVDKIDKLVSDEHKTTVKVDADTSEADDKLKSLEESEKETIKLKGSVDLTDRPQVDAQKLKDVGWENAGDGTATVYSSSYSNGNGDKTVVVTPILPNGDVYEPDALANYAQNLLDGGSDTDGLEIRTYIGDDSIDKANRYSEALHKVQDAYYLGDDAQKEALKSLSNYNAVQLKSVDLSKEQTTFMGKSLSSLMNSLGVGKESLSEFVDVLTDMNLVRPGVELDLSDVKQQLAELSSEEIADKVVRVVGEDDASTVVELWNELKADDKFTSLTAEDQATTVCTLWNIANANPKFTTLSAKDQASYVVDLWNGLSPEEKDAIVKADPTVLNQVIAESNAKLDSLNAKNTNPTITANDNASGVIGYILSLLNSVTSKTVTVTTNHVDTYSKTVSGTVYGGGSGGGHYAKISGTAFASGTLDDSSWINPNWKTKKDQVSLTGEVGRELIVDGSSNRWWTVGDNGAEFSRIPAHAVVFNSKQTEELLSKGYINSRGHGNPNLSGTTSLLSGTAYLGSSTGGFKFSGGATKYNNSYSSTPTQTSTGSTANAQSNNNNGNTSTDSAKEASEKIIDWIETLISRSKRITDLAVDAIDRTVGLLNKQAKAAEAISDVQNEISVNQQALQSYRDYANSLGLDETYASKIRNGTLNIETITDDDLNDKISKYKEYYEKSLDAESKIFELEDKLTELAEKRLSIIEDEYDAIEDIQTSLQDKLEADRDLLEKLGTSIDNHLNTDSISKAIESQSKVYDTLTEKLNAYQNEVQSQLNSGLMKQGSEQWYEAQKNINDFTANIAKASSELIDLQDKLRQINYDTIQYIIDGFSRSSDKISAYIDLLESKDADVPETEYQKQLDNNNSSIKNQYELRNEYLNEQKLYDMGSSRYQELAEKISDADTEILKLQKDNEDLKNSIYSLRIKNLEDAIQKYTDLEGELSSFRDLLNEDAFLNKQGGITDEGLAQITLLSQSLANAKQKISDYTTGLQKVKELYDNGVISLDEYNDKSKEYRDGIQASTKDVKSYQDALTDLYMQSMKTEVDYLDKIISKRKEALDKKKSYYEYDKNIKSQSKDINSLKAQIQALEGVNRLLHL